MKTIRHQHLAFCMEEEILKAKENPQFTNVTSHFSTGNMASVNLCKNRPLTAKLSEPQAPNLQVQSLLCHTDPEARQTWTPRTIHSIFSFLICKMENLILSS